MHGVRRQINSVRPCQGTVFQVHLCEKCLVAQGVEPISKGSGEVLLKDCEYQRAGSANVFVRWNRRPDVYINKVTAAGDGLEFSIFLTEAAARYAAAQKIVPVMDNLSRQRLVLLSRIPDRNARHHSAGAIR
jgi:hypothetical protein